MKPIRLVLIGAAVVVVALLVAVAVAFNSSFQTWAARRVLAKNPTVHAKLGSVDAGLKHVELHDVRVDQNGAQLTLPQLEADLPLLSAGLSQKVFVSRLVAKGWVLDLSKVGAASPAANPAVATPAAVAAAAKEAFSGVFAGLRLPVDLALDGVQLEGEVILPENRGRAKLVLTGGGLGSGREGKFDLQGATSLADPNVNALALRGTLTAAMDTPRTFTKLATKFDVEATGRSIHGGVKLTADIAAARSAAAENYAATVVVANRPLFTARADYPAGGQKLAGTWKLDVRDADLAPFALGIPLPAFTAAGEGTFDTDPAFSSVHASGKLDATAEQLAKLGPEFANVGAVKVATEFNLAQRGNAIAFEQLDATITGTQPIATVRTLQSFTLDAKTRELKAADPARELLAITLQGVPLAWAQPFAKDLTIGGGDVRGELVATTRSGGLTLRAKAPLTVANVSISQSGKPLLKSVDVSVPLAADYAPQGWQADATGLTVKSGNATLLTVDAKAGQLAGENQPIKTTGKLSANLPALLAQPVASVPVALVRGDASVEFAASLGAKMEVQAKVALQNLAADPKATNEKLPTITADLRADIAESGQVALNAPITLERDGRKSDLTVAGTLLKGKEKLTLDAQVTSANLVVDDAKILAALLPQPPPAPAEKTKTPAAPAPAATPASNLPPWAGLDGTLKLALKKVIYSNSFQATDVAGTLKLENGTLKFEKLGAAVGDGTASANGAVTFDPKAAQPYGLKADVAAKDVDLGPLFKAIDPKQPPTVEGKFNTTSLVAGQAPTLAELLFTTTGDFHLSSSGGVYRGIPISVSNAAESTGRLAGIVAALGSAAGAITGRKDYSDIGSKAQALAEFANFIRAIPYDQLSVNVTREPTLNGTLRDFTLIAPEIRLTGTGTTMHRPGASPLDDSLAMEFKLRVRGRAAELVKYLGLLDPQTDDLGYATCTLPLKVGGTVSHPDTSELNQRLATLVLEKTGVTEKAGELFNRLIGGGK